MKIIDDKAEERLISDIEGLSSKNAHKTCIWIKGKLVADEKRSAFNTQSICAKIEAYVDDAKTNIYECTDGDLFILTPELSARQYHDLSHAVAKWLGESVENVVALYDLSLQLQEVESAVKAKMLKIIEHNTQPQAINNDLTRTISARRLERQHAEIMIAGEDEFSKQIIECVLKKDYSVRFAGDARETVWKYVAIAPDILFIDNNMIENGGEEIIQKILSYDPKAHIVIFCGNCPLDYTPDMLPAGIKGFVSKPFSKQKLDRFIEASEHMLPRLVQSAILQ